MLACEYESELYSFMMENAGEQDFCNSNFSYLTKDELLDLGPLLSKKNITLQSGFTLPQPGIFRRIIRVDFSAGAQFCTDIYDKVMESATNALMTFWANRVTLVKFGRKYCTNFFKNLIYCAKNETIVPIQNYFGSVEKPIIVFGAGESLAQGVDFIKKSESGAKTLYFSSCVKKTFINFPFLSEYASEKSIPSRTVFLPQIFSARSKAKMEMAKIAISFTLFFMASP